MPTLIQFYRANLQRICLRVWNPQSQALAKMVALGELNSAWSWRLFREYKQWGILHLVILSGMQFFCFVRGWELTVQLLQRTIFGRSSPRFAKLSAFPASYVFLAALGFSPRLVRCALLYAATTLLTPIVNIPRLVIAIAFGLHMLVIENMHPSRAAVLSWAAFFILIAARDLFNKPIVRAIFITALFQIALSFLREQPLSVRRFTVALVGNLVALPFYQTCLFPLIGVISAVTLLTSALWMPQLSDCIFRVFIAPAGALAVDLMLAPVLVAHSAFRYTFHE